jgi:hypothetical protein
LTITVDVDHTIREQLRAIEADHASRMRSIDFLDALAANTEARHAATTRKLLENLRSITPTGSPVCDEIDEAEARLLRTPAG